MTMKLWHLGNAHFGLWYDTFYNYETKLNISRVEQMILDILKLTIKCILICLDYS